MKINVGPYRLGNYWIRNRINHSRLKSAMVRVPVRPEADLCCFRIEYAVAENLRGLVHGFAGSPTRVEPAFRPSRGLRDRPARLKTSSSGSADALIFFAPQTWRKTDRGHVFLFGPDHSHARCNCFTAQDFVPRRGSLAIRHSLGAGNARPVAPESSRPRLCPPRSC